MFSLNKSLAKLKSLKKDKKQINKKENNEVNVDKSKVKKKSGKKSKSKSKQKIINEKLTPGVVKLENIPHGFYEKEMRKYFSQFGTVLRLRLSRSRKTGKSRGYAYIEFECDEVAKIVAETMDNYLMFNHILKCSFIPPEKMPPKLFKYSKRISTVSFQKLKHNNINRSFEKEMKLVYKRLKHVKDIEKKLSDMGINFKCTTVNIPTEKDKEEFIKNHSRVVDVEKERYFDEKYQNKLPKLSEVSKRQKPEKRKNVPIEKISVKNLPGKNLSGKNLSGKNLSGKNLSGKKLRPLRPALYVLPKYSLLRAASLVKKSRKIEFFCK